MTYPNTTLPDDTLDPEYGGRPASEFGQPAWQWINGVVRFLAQSFLAYQRVPYTTVAAVSQDTAAVGDVAVFVSGVAVASGTYDVRPWTAGLANPLVFGIYLEASDVGALRRIITGGIVPREITGLSTQTASTDAGLGPDGRVRAAQVGDVVIGTIDLNGNLHFTGAGLAAP